MSPSGGPSGEGGSSMSWPSSALASEASPSEPSEALPSGEPESTSPDLDRSNVAAESSARAPSDPGEPAGGEARAASAVSLAAGSPLPVPETWSAGASS
eukprot:CAMPEP_0115126470 /NCGR_PEP_ID=MMETSP0227-20121206/49758_1 /TAXON_ID=89957 /ORGANISM="Polarella glacialis, Strain CCMP 1383" /LENGTH=98 /DNA_ID=CAMNT_0002530241 /DNA_START=437 /DNA_END=729 /DNA_ORIENTATION=+